MTGKQVKLFLVDGTPGGVKTAEITNWTGHLVSGGRSDLGQLLQRDELGRTGVYLLLGDDENAPGGIRSYIGEADVIATRLRFHNNDEAKDWWESVVVITSKDANLTKAHARYLESRLIQLAHAAQRSHVENGTAPPPPPLPEADASDMDYFLSQLQIVLPVLGGVNVFRGRTVKPAPAAAPVEQATTSPVFRLDVTKQGLHGTAQQVDGEFTLLEGSLVAPPAIRENDSYSRSTAQSHAGYRAIHQKLVADGSIVIDGVVGRLTRDTVLTSPSAAGAIVTGRSCNGRTSWVTDDGVTFGAWESRGVG